jgi:hypothetical protein
MKNLSKDKKRAVRALIMGTLAEASWAEVPSCTQAAYRLCDLGDYSISEAQRIVGETLQDMDDVPWAWEASKKFQ